MQTLRIAVIAFITTAWITTTMATEFFVAPDGSDANPGTRQQPFRSVAKAQQQVRESGLAGQQPVTVQLRKGTHYLSDTLVFTPADSGSADAPVRYVAHDGEDAVISGGVKLDLEWTPYRDGILQAKVPAGLEMDQLFVNGARLNMARYPNYDPNVRVFNGYAEDAFSRERAARWKDPAGGYMHAIHRARWGGFHYRITGKDEDGGLTYEGGWQNNRQMGMHKSMRMVENIFEELDAPGEWFHNADTGVLYVYPPEGVALEQAEVVTAQLAHLVDFVGSKAKPVRWLALEGITFRHTARTFMKTKEPLLRSDWTIYRGGAVTLTGAAHCRIADCFFDSPGGNAIFVNQWNRTITVKGLHFREVGASAVAFVGSPDAVRNPKFEYRQQNQYDEIDMTPGPKSDDYRVGEGAPFLAFGFKNFPMDRFGVQKPALKAIARVPEFPTPRKPEPTGSSNQTSAWLGATVQALTGEAFSTFGVSKEEGGIHLVTVSAKSQAAAAGLKAGDVVQKINGRPTKTVAELEKLTETFFGKPLTVTLVRGQQEMALQLP